MHQFSFTDEEVKHIKIALMVYSFELVRDLNTMPLTQKNVEYIDRQRIINCFLSTYMNMDKT